MNEQVQEFIDDIQLMRRCYADARYSRAEQLRDDLANRLEDIMQLNPSEDEK